MTERQVLMDSGATDNFISNKLLKRLKIGKLQLKNPRTVWNIDGTHNKSGTIRECVNLLVHRLGIEGMISLLDHRPLRR